MHLPTKLRESTESQQIYVASNKYVFMNRVTFLIWAYNFIHFLTDYASKIKDQSINKNAFLFLKQGKSTCSRISSKNKCYPSSTSVTLQSCIVNVWQFNCCSFKKDISKYLQTFLSDIQIYENVGIMTNKVRLAE